MTVFLIIIICILIIAALFCLRYIKNNSNLLEDIKNIQEQKEQIEENIKFLSLSKSDLQKDVQDLDLERSSLINAINKYKDAVCNYKTRIKDLNENLSLSIKSQEEISKQAYKSYCDLLDEKYEETDKEYNKAIETLQEHYDDFVNKLNISYEEKKQQQELEMQSIKDEIENLKATRQAAIEAARREKKIQEDIKHYCLILTDEDMSDIAKLNSIKKTLNKPRILSMLIWQTWFQKPLKTLSADILGTKEITGIYKITNTLTNECYIGQSVDIAKRWAEHAKCGLGIDTPAGNKLYAAMKEYGLWSFSWELLEECPKIQLNEKEAFYISMYQADIFGYNSNKGLTK